MSQQQAISAAFAYKANFVEVNGAKLHYIEEGQGRPILFLHGIPTWSYLWRNVIPYLSDQAHCIAVDLMGMGKSDKPDITYSVFEHIDYITGFIEALDLRDVTLVMHGWGSIIGFHYAMTHPDNIYGLAFLESHIRPVTEIDMVSLPLLEMASVMSSEDGGYDIVMNSNYFVNTVMPSGVLRTLTDEEMQQYQMPFQTPGSCQPLWQYLQELPLGTSGDPKVLELITQYSQQLTQSDLPKLMLYAIPGFITTIDTVRWAKDNLPNLTLVDIGDALHYAQESNPEKIGAELATWFTQVGSK